MVATYFYINDSGGNTWQIGVDDSGILSASEVASQSPAAIDLNAGGASWRLGIGTDGRLSTASETFNGAYLTYVTIASPSGYFYQVGVDSNGILSTTQVFAQSLSAVGQIASAMALGVASALLSISLAGRGIGTGEAFATADLNQNLWGAGALASAGAFGAATLKQQISAVGGIASEGAFGTAKLIQRIIALGGIASREALGRAAFLYGQTISGVGGIPTGESWGTAQVWPALVGSSRRVFKTVGRERTGLKQKETRIFKTGPRPRGGA